MQQQSRRDGVVVVETLAMRIDAAAERAGDRLRRSIFAVARRRVGHRAAPEEGKMVPGSKGMVELERRSLGVSFDEFRILKILNHTAATARRSGGAEGQGDQVLDLWGNGIEPSPRDDVAQEWIGDELAIHDVLRERIVN